MKIEKEINFVKTVDIDINPGDIGLLFEHPDTHHELMTLFNDIAGIVKVVPQELIDKLTDGQKRAVAGFFADQLHRLGFDLKKQPDKVEI